MQWRKNYLVMQFYRKEDCEGLYASYDFDIFAVTSTASECTTTALQRRRLPPLTFHL